MLSLGEHHAYDLSEDEMESPRRSSRSRGATIEPEDLESANWERYPDARVSVDVELNGEQPNGDEDVMRHEFPELFDMEEEEVDGSANIATMQDDTPAANVAGSIHSSRSSNVGSLTESIHIRVGARTLNEGINIDTPDIAMLRGLNADYPYGQTNHMNIPDDLTLAFDYFRVKIQHNMANSAFEDMMKVGKRVSMGQEELESYRTVASVLGSYTAINHVRYDCCRNNCLCFADWPDEKL